ncbi:fructose-16-bisphosphatase [Fusarium albosuccineum]|uniref:Fructose-16-bisphosphatase n=1 Tax=Fusarium albosuccineum TaxID=1237068 RepID=A0A8H4NWZ6_9HYPO|nr:fructose-16-bisphosphatase [Fusarium albosuccineum]
MSPSRTAKTSELELNKFLSSFIPQESHSAIRDSVIPELLRAVSAIGKGLRSSHDVAIVGTENVFGDEQLNVDVLAEKIIRDSIAKCPSISTASSEEDPVERSTGNVPDENTGAQRYTVAFDPLDGSSIIGPNWSVGTIVGIWEGETSINQPSEKQIAAILGVYGPRTLAIVALRIPGARDVCFEVSLDDSDTIQVVRPEIRFAEPPFKTRYFAPANLRAAAENEKYMNLVTKFISEKCTLRYSGGLIPDLFHALVKGQGVYISPVTATSKAKLRRLYELLPVALMIECAGGQAIDPETGLRILDTPLKGCDDRAGLVCGTPQEVDAVKAALLS